MSEMIRSFDYSKSAGRGRGILGLSNAKLCRAPGSRSNSGDSAVCGSKNRADSTNHKPNGSSNQEESRDGTGVSKLLIAMHNYKANPSSPGGFPELALTKGQLVMLVKEHPENEHWWEVKNEDGETGYVPSSYVIIKDDQALPWLQLTSLKQEEEERKARVKRLAQQKSAADGAGLGPAPKDSNTSQKAKPYVSAYSRTQSGTTASSDPDRYYCKICDKRLNGPKPYGAHMTSKAHKEELALLEDP